MTTDDTRRSDGQTTGHTLTDAERTDLREAILRAGYGGDGYVFAAVERILAARGGNTALRAVVDGATTGDGT